MTQSARLTSLVAAVRNHRMTPTERRAQRVSMVMGLRGHSSTLTKEKVQTLLDEFEGSAA
jgi:poly-beta-hydroxyalkanoate depolymerase